MVVDPKLKDGAGLVEEYPELLPMLKPPEPEEAAPNPNPVGLPAPGVLEVADAPPNDNWGADPPGPNFPSLAGGVVDDTLSRFADGVKDLESGVEGCRGPEGANENRLEVGFLSVEGVPMELEGPNEKDLAGVAASFFSSVSFVSESVLPSITSCTSFVTSADGFLGVSTGLGVLSADLDPKENEKGDEEEVEFPEGTVGVKPFPKVELLPVTGLDEV